MSVSGDHSNKVIPCLYQGKQPSFHWHSVASRLRGNATQAKHGRTTSESTWSTCIIRVPPNPNQMVWNLWTSFYPLTLPWPRPHGAPISRDRQSGSGKSTPAFVQPTHAASAAKAGSLVTSWNYYRHLWISMGRNICMFASFCILQIASPVARSKF
jgi:hypothetical protein